MLVLDVRTPDEIAAGKIKGALEMDYYSKDFKQRLQGLDKNKTIVVYCASGRRSADTVKQLHEAGFKNVYNLAGGYKGYKAP